MAGRLSYNGTIYTIAADDIGRLLARGVIVADASYRDAYELAPDHLIEELPDAALVVSRRTGAEARGGTTDVANKRLLAVRYLHRDGQVLR